MRSSDIYVHAEIQGASSVIVRNPTDGDVPPKTLLEAGTMAISYSVAWDAKVVTNAYWVRSDQVSKTAPTGEYLGTGSFMIRGKKNFLPFCHLIMGLSLLFKLEDSFVEKHRGERKVRSFDEEQEQQAEQQLKMVSLENEQLEDVQEDVEVELEEGDVDDDDDNDNDDKKKNKLVPVNNINDVDNDDDVPTNDIDPETLTEFPDTQVKVEHDTGRITIKNKLLNVDGGRTKPCQQVETTEKLVDEEEESTIIPAAPSRKKQQQNSKKRKEEKDRKSQKDQKQQIQLQQQQSLDECQNKNNSQAVKRGQKGKLKKIKAKYKDQDEEERQLRMQILKSAGKFNQISSDPKLEEAATAIKNIKPKRPMEQGQTQEGGDLEDVDDAPTGVDVEMIDSLTGIPYDQDELLFVIPVIAPYQALQNYKYVLILKHIKLKSI